MGIMQDNLCHPYNYTKYGKAAIIYIHIICTCIFALVDIDECSMNTTMCHDLAQCVNTNGSYTCKCMTGYEGNGVDNCSGT